MNVTSAASRVPAWQQVQLDAALDAMLAAKHEYMAARNHVREVFARWRARTCLLFALMRKYDVILHF